VEIASVVPQIQKGELFQDKSFNTALIKLMIISKVQQFIKDLSEEI
jgi:hypothetical protein